MQVTCPGCQSRFKLPEGVQPGARLRCSVCGTIFALPGDAEAQEPATPAPEGAPAASASPAVPQTSSPAASPDRPAGAASLPEAPETPEAPASSASSEAPESRRSGWAVWLLVLALAAGACLCIAWQVSESFRDAVMGRPQTGQKQTTGSSAEPSSSAGPSTAVPAPAQASGDVAGSAPPGAAAEGDGKSQAPDQAQGKTPQAGAPAGIEKLSLQNVRQYFVENKKVGRILVVEGAVRNLFDEPRSAIRVEAVLIGKDKKVVEAKRQTAGAQLSHFQLQVMDKVEMEAALASEADISLTNANVPPGGEVPFMVLFYNPSMDVAEFAAKILEARHPAR